MAQRLFYRIKEVAHRLGEPVSTIRYWESVFPQVKPHTTPKGVRQYNERDIETLRRIQHLLREKGMTIEGASAELRSRASTLESRTDTLLRLRQIGNLFAVLRDALD